MHHTENKTFFLGSPEPSWLAKAGVPLFVSDRRLRRLKSLPRAIAPWALDSGAFTEISQHQRWTTTPEQYAERVRRYRDEIGLLQWAAPMDLMCEREILEKKGAPVEHHQMLTIRNYLRLKTIAPDLPWIPVIQGQGGPVRYWEHQRAYEAAGIDLAKEPVVGVGSICRRQGMTVAGAILATLQSSGLRLHAFGMKTQGLLLNHRSVVSADSMAWSFDARNTYPLPGHTHKSCSSCLEYALAWRKNLLNDIAADMGDPLPFEYTKLYQKRPPREASTCTPCDGETD